MKLGLMNHPARPWRKALFRLDVGHANIGRRPEEPNLTGELVEAFGDRLSHMSTSATISA
jgi:hypothetical protein